MRDESVKDGNRINDIESFQSSADEQDLMMKTRIY